MWPRPMGVRAASTMTTSRPGLRDMAFSMEPGPSSLSEPAHQAPRQGRSFGRYLQPPAHPGNDESPVEAGASARAGYGNRTRLSSLGSSRSTDELIPREGAILA